MRIKHFSTLRFSLILLIAAPSFAGEAMDPQVLKKVKAATVYIRVLSPEGPMQGSGFFAAKDIIVTNAHVVGVEANDDVPPGPISIAVNSGIPGSEFVLNCEFVSADPNSDVAFLRVKDAPGKVLPEPLTFATGAELSETMPIYIFGFPFGNALAVGANANPAVTIGPGSVSSLRVGAEGLVEAVQLNGNLNPGNSGGPVVDARGRVIAVSVATVMGTQIGLAIPCDKVNNSFSGRIRGSKFSNCKREGPDYTFDVEVELLDPLSKVNSVQFYWWTGLSSEARPIHPTTKLPGHGARSDSARSTVVLTRDADGKWKGRGKGVRVDIGRILISHFGYTRRGEAERLTGAHPMTDVLLTAFVDEGVIGARGNSTPADTSKSNPGENPGGVVGAVPSGAPSGVVKSLKSRTVDAKQERDDKGQSYTRVVTTVEKRKLGESNLLQMVAAPSGQFLFACFEGNSSIQAYDPEDFSVKREFNLPRAPVSIWCDSKRLVAACKESKLVTIVDLETNKILKSVPMRDMPESEPLSIIGRAPDGSYMTVWKKPGDAWWDHYLVLIDDTGKIRLKVKGAIDWATIVNNGTRVYAQHNFRGGPSGVPNLYDVATGKEISLMNNKLFGPDAAFHCNFAHCFLTFDRQYIVMPKHAQRDMDPYYGKTYLVKPDMSRIDLEMDGVVIAEVPSENIFVGWYRTGDLQNEASEIRYYSRSTGRIIRRITAKGMRPHPAAYLIVNPIPGTIFIPGHELFIYKDFNDRSNNIEIVRCGPVATAAATNADPNVVLTNDPPVKALVGKLMSYTPTFVKPAASKNVTFKLKKSVDGMQIDPNTGKVTLMPTDANLGKYDVSVVADVDGLIVPLISWVLEIELP